MTLVEEQAGAMTDSVPELPKRLEPLAMAAVRNAAMAAYVWAGRGDGKAADGAATEAMREALNDAHELGNVVIGEGAKDKSPMLYNGEKVGVGDKVTFDIAVDPVEGTDLCAAGQAGALTTIAFAGAGGLWSPGPALYMDKLVCGPEARDVLDLRDEPERVLKRVAAALGKRPRDMVVVVLDKPRHVELIASLRACGARVQTPTAGDVAGALLAALPGTGVDLLMGCGGTPEGVMAACAVKCVGGGMQGRLNPQKDYEAKAIEEAGLSTTEIFELDDLVKGNAMFAATAITGGTLGLSAPRRAGGWNITHSIIVRPGSVRRIVESRPVTDQE